MVELLVIIMLNTEEPYLAEGALFNEHDWEYVIEARRRGKQQKKRRRGGNGLR